MALIEFIEVRLAPKPAERILGYALDGPRFRSKAAAEAVEFNGWIVGDPVPVAAVELRRGGETLHRLAADRPRLDVGAAFDRSSAERSGFKAQLDLSALGPAEELQLVAVFADGTEFPFVALSTLGAASSLAAIGAAASVPIADLPDRGAAVPLPRASVIVPVHGASHYTRQCLNTVMADRSPAPRFEVIVVDDASPDDTAARLAEYGEKIRVVSLAQNTGFAAACNAGAAAARGDYLVFLNNDTVPQSGWLGGLASYANVTPAATVVGAKLLFPDHTVQHAGVAIGLDRYPHHLYAGFSANHPAVDKPRRFRAVTAACCLIRRGAFQAVGGFDRAFVNGWEDVDLCLRLAERGYEIHYAPQSVVYHFESTSRSPNAPAERHNRELYARRWLDKVEPDLLRYFVEDGLLRVLTETPLYPLLFEASPLIASFDVSQHETLQLVLEKTEQVALLQRAVADLQERLLAAEQRAEAAETSLGAGLPVGA